MIVTKPLELQRKGEVKGRRGIMVGYDLETKGGWQIYYPDTKRVVVATDVSFDESWMSRIVRPDAWSLANQRKVSWADESSNPEQWDLPPVMTDPAVGAADGQANGDGLRNGAPTSGERVMREDPEDRSNSTFRSRSNSTWY